LLGRRLNTHLPIAEVAPHGRGPLAAVGQSARRSWVMGSLLRGGGGVVQRLLPHGMTWWNCGVVPPYYNPPCHVQITPVIWVGISKGIRGHPPYHNWEVVPGVLSDAPALGHNNLMLTVVHKKTYTRLYIQTKPTMFLQQFEKNVSVPSTLHSEIGRMLLIKFGKQM